MITQKIYHIGFLIIVCLVLFLPANVMDVMAWKLLSGRMENLFAAIGIAVVFLQFKCIRQPIQYIGKTASKMVAVLPDGWLIFVLALLFFLMTCNLSGTLFGHLPHIADSQAHYVQAKIFASGHLAAPKHPLQYFFPIEWFAGTNNYYSVYPPGHAFMLALGLLIGLPWIINPLMGSLFIVAIYFLGREIGNRVTGYISMFLAIVSPFVVFMSSEYMSHATALLMLTLFVLFYIRMLKYRRWQDAVFAGLALGYLGLTRPQCVMILAIFYVFHALWMCFSRFRQYAWLNLLIAVSALPFFCVFLYHNWFMTGNPFTSGYGPINNSVLYTWLRPGSKWHIFPVEDFTRAAIQIGILNVEFFCWPIPSFALIAVLLLMQEKASYSSILLGTVLANFFGLTLIAINGLNIFSARYLYEVSGMVIVLSALALQRIPAMAQRYFFPAVSLYTWSGTLILTCLSFTIAGFYGRTGEIYRVYGHHYWEGNADYYNKIMAEITTPALVFIQDYNQLRYVITAMPTNDKSPVIFALNIPDKNQRLMAYYPDRHVYSVAGNVTQQRQLGGVKYDMGGCLPDVAGYSIIQIK